MTTDSWAGAVSADWDVASDWSDDTIPNSVTTDVTIAAAGSYTLDISSSETFTVDSLTLNASGATLNVAGALLLAGTTDTLFLDAGNLVLGSGGTVAGGTIVANGGALLGQGGTLSGIAYQGTLDLSAQYTSLTLTGGTAFSGVGGTGAATINFDGPAFQNSYLYVLGTETLDNATIDIGAGEYGENYLVNEDAGSGGAILTLGPNLLLEQVGGSGALISDDRAGDGIVNDGTILAESGTFTLDATGFTNDGSVIVTSGAVINVTGQVAAGLINSIVESDGGEVQIGGTVNGGTILAPDGAVGGDGGTLVSVSYQGTLDLSAAYSNLTLAGGTSFSGAGGSGAATINFNGPSFQNSYLYVLGSQTLDNTTIDIGAGGYSTNYLIDEDSNGNGILTLGPNLLLNQVGGSVQLLNGNGSGDGIVNDGTILATGGTFAIDATNFTNDGTIAVAAGFINLVGNATTTLINSIVESDGGMVQIGGTVNGGTILAPDGAVGGDGGTLVGVSYQGTLNLSASYSNLTLTGDTTFSGAGGSGAATINFDGPSFQNSYLYVLGSQTLDNATIDIGAGGYSTNYLIEEDSGGNGILTLGPNLLLNQVGGSVQLLNGNGSGDGVVNDGTILATGGTFTIDATNFTNDGSIVVAAGFIDLVGNATTTLINSIVESDGGVVQIGGIVNGGTIDAPDGGVGGAGGTLDGVSYQGTLDLSASYSSLTLTGDTTFSGAGGSGAATINFDGPSFQNSYLYVLGSQTLDNATLDIGSGGYAENYLVNQDSSGTGAILTLGSNLTIDQVGGPVGLTSSDDAGDGIINDGTINAGAGSTFTIDATNFTNNGSIDVANGFIDLTGDPTAALINSINKSAGGVVQIGGVVNGGTILAPAGGVGGAGGTLVGVTYQGTLDLSASYTSLTIADGISLSGAGGSGAATINLDGPSFQNSYLYMLGNETLDNATLDLGSGGYAENYLVNQDGSGTGAVLTLGPNLTINYVGGAAALTSTNDAGDGIVNDGTIVGSAVNGVLDISPDSFTNAGFVTALDDDQVLIQSATFANSGSLTAASDGTIAIDATAFGNLSGTTLTGGSFEADANATLLLPTDASIQTDAADITLSGSISVIESSVGGSNVPIDATLNSIDPAAALNLLNGRNFASAQDFVDDGTLQLGASTFDTASLTVGAGGSAFGYGTIVPATVNDGAITAAGGLLDLNAAITGSGGLFIDPGATLELDGTVAQNVTFNATDAETLILSDPSGFTGTLMNLTAGDSIDLVGVSVTSAVVSDGTIIAALTGGGTLAIAAPATNGLQVGVGSDGNGGSTLNLQTAQGQAVPEVVSGDTITLADAHIAYGSPEDQIAVAIANIATAPADGLDVAIGATTGDAYASGTITSLPAGDTDSSDIIVGLDNSNAGALSGTVGLAFTGDGSVSGDTGALSDQTLDLSGNVYAYASPSIVAPSNAYVHVGDDGGTFTEPLSITNAAAADGYSENLDASVVGTFDGVVGAGGTVTGIAAGASDDSSLNVTVSTATAGIYSDTVEVAATSDGTGIDSLGTTALGTYYVPVTVEVDNYATAAIEQTNVGASYGSGVLSEAGNTYTLDLGTLAAGAADAIVGLNLANTAIGPADTLDAVVGLAGDPAFADTLTNSGTVSVLAGQSLTFDTVDLPATNAGAFSEALTLNETDTNASGFSEILPTQTVVVTGTVVSGAGLAAPVINNGPTIVLPDVHTGATDQTALSITNTTTGTATLVAGVDLLTGDATGSGFISGLAPGATDDSSITVGLNTSQPGAQSGTVSLQLVSNGTFVSNGEGVNLVINGGFEDGTTGWTSSNPSSSSGSFGIPAHSGNYFLSLGAVGSDAYTSQTLATQVGTEYAISLWYWASGNYPDDLNVYFGSDHILSLVDPAQAGWTEYTEDAVATSASTLLEIGAYNNPSWDGVDDVSVVATGTSATGSVLLPTQTVTVQGNVYSEAEPSISGPYGVYLHVGDDGGTYTGALTVTNGAPANGYSEGLDATVTGVSYGSATASGSTADIAAGQSDDTSLTISQSTANAGAYYSVVDVAGTSDGTGIDQFGSTSLGTYDVGVYILVNNYATAAVEQADNGALLAGANNTYAVDLGTFDLNSGTVYDNLDIANTASGQADYLAGNISAAAAAAFSDTGTGSFGDIGAGGADQFTVDMSTANTGVFTQDIVVSPTDANDSGYSQALAGETIVVTGTVSTPTDTAQPVINTPTVLALPDVHVGDSADPDNLQAVSISNIGSAGLYVVPGALTGQGAATGEIQDLAPGGTDDTDLAVGINDTSAGSQSGSVALSFVSLGTGAATPTGGNIVANGDFEDGDGGWDYSNAGIVGSGFASIPAESGNDFLYLYGGSASATQTLNTVAGDDYQIQFWYYSTGVNPNTLNVSFGGVPIASVTNAPSAGWQEYTATLPALSNNTALTFSGGSSGWYDGIDNVSVTDLGSGSGNIVLPSQTIAVSGNVYNLADPSVTLPDGAPILHVGDGGGTVTVPIYVANIAPADGYSEGLDASVTGATSGAIPLSTLSLVGSAQMNGAAVQLTDAGGEASGAWLGSAIAADQSFDTTFSFSLTSLGDNPQADGIAFVIQGAGPSALGDGGGDVGLEGLPGNTAAIVFQSWVNDHAGIVLNSDPYSAPDSLPLGSAGTVTGIADVAYDATSDTLTLTSTELLDGVSYSVDQTVSVDLATWVGQSLYLGFTAGTGGSESNQQITAWNVSTAASPGQGSSDITAAGSTGDIAAGQTNTTGLTASISTATAGTEIAAVQVAETSDGTGVDTLGLTNLGTAVVGVQATILNYATAAVVQTGGVGSLTGSGTDYTVNLGEVALDSAPVSVDLGVENIAQPISDLLEGSFSTASGDAEIGVTTGSFSAVGAGAVSGTVVDATLDTDDAGVFTQQVVLNPTGYNSSGYSGSLAPETITITGTVADLANAVVNTPSPINFGGVRANTTPGQAISISNVATPPADNLDATATASDDATVSGSINGLAPGGTDDSSIVAGLVTTTPGVVNGDVALDFVSDGVNGIVPLTNQNAVVAVTGTVYGEATYAVSPPAAVILHVGDAGDGSFTVQNTAPAAYSENLDADVTGTSGAVSTSSSGAGPIAPQGSGTIPYAIDTATAGTITGSVNLSLDSDGTGIDGSGPTPIGSDDVSIRAIVDNYATAAVVQLAGAAALVGGGDDYTVNLGDMAQGSAAESVLLGVQNDAQATADLLAGSFASSGDTEFSVSTSAFSGLSAGQTSGGVVDVALNTGQVGTFSEQVVLTPTGYNASGYSGGLAPETITVTGTVTQALAEAQVNTASPIDFGGVREGDDATPQAISISNIATPPAASLDATATASSQATVSGAISLLAAGGTDDSSIVAGLDTSTPGIASGAIDLSFVSDGADGQVPLTGDDAELQVTGTVYGEASGSASTPDALILHVGDPGTGTIDVQNTAPAPYSENLLADVTGTSGGVTASGDAGSIAAGDSGSISYTIDTSSAGTIAGDVSLQYQSNGTGLDGDGPTPVGTQDVPIDATVNNYAVPEIQSSEGTLTQTGADSYDLYIGYVSQGGSALSTQLSVLNGATGPADDLSGSYSVSGDSAFSNSGFSDFSGVGAGASDAGGDITLDPTNLGIFKDTLTLDPTDSNASGYSQALTPVTVTVEGDVLPAPGSSGSTGGGGTGSSGSSGSTGSTSSTGSTGSTGSGPTGSTGSGPTGSGPTGGTGGGTGGTGSNAPAQATIQSTEVDIGIVRVGETGTQQLTITNSASPPAGNLNATVDQSSLSSGVVGSGTINNLAPGASDSSTISVGVNTGTAGVVNGTATIDFSSSSGSTGNGPNVTQSQDITFKSNPTGVSLDSGPLTIFDVPISFSMNALSLVSAISPGLGTLLGALGFGGTVDVTGDVSLTADFALNGASQTIEDPFVAAVSMPGTVGAGQSFNVNTFTEGNTPSIDAELPSMTLTLTLNPSLSYTGSITYPTSLNPFNPQPTTTAFNGTAPLSPLNFPQASLGSSINIPDPPGLFGAFFINIPNEFASNAGQSISSSPLPYTQGVTFNGLIPSLFGIRTPNLFEAIATAIGNPEVIPFLQGDFGDGNSWTLADLSGAYGAGLSDTMTFTPSQFDVSLQPSWGSATAPVPVGQSISLTAPSTGGSDSITADYSLAGTLSQTLNATRQTSFNLTAGELDLFNNLIQIGPLFDQTLVFPDSSVPIGTTGSSVSFSDQDANFTVTVGSTGSSGSTGGNGSNGGLPGTPLPSQNITVTGTVDNIAIATPVSDGDLEGGGSDWVLNLGTVDQGDDDLTAALSALNSAPTDTPSDTLDGTWVVDGGDGFTNDGFNSFSALAAGDEDDGGFIDLSSGTTGTFSEDIQLIPYSTNTSESPYALPTVTIQVEGTVTGTTGCSGMSGMSGCTGNSGNSGNSGSSGSSGGSGPGGGGGSGPGGGGGSGPGGGGGSGPGGPGGGGGGGGNGGGPGGPGGPGGSMFPDPHLLTFDGLYYSFQTAGEFVLVKSNVDTFQVQVRISAPVGVSSYSVITEVGIQVGNDVVTIDSTRAVPVWVNGIPQTFTSNEIGLAAGVITETSAGFVVTLDTGESVTTDFNIDGGTQTGPSTTSGGISISVSLGPTAQYYSVEGLMGDYSGNPATDLTLADGTQEPSDMSTSVLYGTYADSWRVTQATSLLDYGPGQTTATFTDTNYPGTPISVDSFPANEVAAATALVAQQGITDPGLQQAAIYDYLITGNASILSVESNLQQQGATTVAQAAFVAPPAPVEVGVQATETSQVEANPGTTTATFQIYSTGSITSPVTIDYAVVAPDDTYVGAGDFGGVLPSGSVTLAAGQDSTNLAISILGNIGTAVSQTLELQVSAASPVVVIGSTAEETIINDAPVPGTAPVFGLEVSNYQALLPSQSGTSWTFDLGNLKQGQDFSPGTLSLAALNLAAGGSDDLGGTIVASGSGGLPSTELASFATLAPGAIQNIANVDVATASPGVHTEQFVVTPDDTNISGYDAVMPAQTITVTDTIYPLAQALLSTDTIDFGVVRGGSVQQQAIGITNDGPSGAEQLDAGIGAITGAGAGTGSFTLLSVGHTSSAVAVGLNTSGGGIVSGTVAIDPSSDGTNVDGLGVTPLLPQEVTVSGTVYREAQAGVALTDPILHVGDPGTDTLTVTNTDPADGYSENLIAGLTGVTGGFTTSSTGPTGEIVAGNSDSTTFGLTLSTAQAGTVSGSVTLALATDGGTGPGSIDGFGLLSLAPETVGLTATIDNYATAEVVQFAGTPALVQNGNDYSLDFGTVALGATAPSVEIGVENAAAAVADLLEGSFTSSGNAAIALTGFSAFTDLGAQQVQRGMDVMLTTSEAGVFTQQVTLDPTGYNAGGYSGALAPEVITVTGTVTAQAEPVLNTSTLTLPNQRVASAPLADAVSFSNGATPPAESLDVAIAGTTGAASASGSITLLAAGQTDASDISAGVSTNSAGAQSGTVTFDEYTDGTGTDGQPSSLLGTATLSVRGAVYREAAASVGTVAPVILHTGQVVDLAVAIGNTAATDGFSEDLIGNVVSSSAGISATTASTGAIAAGGSGTIGVALTAVSAGVLSGTIGLGLVSDGTPIDGLGTVALGTPNVAVTGTIYNYATAAVTQSGSGTLTASGDAYTLNLGTIAQGATLSTAVLELGNVATGLADSLVSTLTLSGGTANFINSGVGSIGVLAAGQQSGQIDIALHTGTAGTFTETLTFADSSIDSGGTTALAPVTVTVTGTVAAPPGQVFILTSGTDTVNGGGGQNLVIATTGALSSGDVINAGTGGANTLALQGAGIFNLTLPTTLTGIETIAAQEGQPSAILNGDTYVSTVQTVYLRAGENNVTVQVAPGTPNPGNPSNESITVIGAANNDAIDLGSGADTVTMGAGETLNGGSGNDTILVTAATISDVINGGSGDSKLWFTGGGTVTVGGSVTNIASVYLASSTTAWSFTANTIAGLVVQDASTGTSDNLAAGGANQTLTGGGAGKLTMTGATDTIFENTSTLLNGDTIKNFAIGDTIDLTDLGFTSQGTGAGQTSLGFTENAQHTAGTLAVQVGGVQKVAITLTGTFVASNFSIGSDGVTGTDIGYR